ncbi:hypothetical protein CPB83DRAFT_946317 [Crepidotus variabilis]|uniref:Uncharacterized protein n=1 Tax=Crepidotus variabilis TaxID=179855 RepID=A0A9P6E8Z2_9AGAR|nr:hypothetical protein CPB83DRAFT_946317 [Crepidotus variabilis]
MGAVRTTFAMVDAKLVRRKQIIEKVGPDPYGLPLGSESRILQSLEQANAQQELSTSLLSNANKSWFFLLSLQDKKGQSVIQLLMSQPTLLENHGLLHAKRLVDRVIDSTSVDRPQEENLLSKAGETLEKYFFTIAFASYIEESDAITFLRSKATRLRFNVFAPVSDLSSLSKSGSASRSLLPERKNDVATAGGQILGDKYSDHVVKNRSSIILQESMLLKSDQWLSQSQHLEHDRFQKREGGISLQYSRIPTTAERPPDYTVLKDLIEVALSTPPGTPIVQWTEAHQAATPAPMKPSMSMSAVAPEKGPSRYSYQAINSMPFKLNAEIHIANFGYFSDLLRVIRKGPAVKQSVDDAIDLCSAVINLRDAIETARVQAEEANDDKQKKIHTSKALQNLRRYFELMMEVLTPSSPWMKEVAGVAYPDEVTRIVVNRSGNILSASTIIKSDFFSNLRKMTLPERIDGSPNFRRVPMMLKPVSSVSASLEEDTYDFKVQDSGSGRMVCARATGVATAVVEGMKSSFKKDVLRELKLGNGRILLHDEGEERPGVFSIILIWEDVEEEDIITPRDVFDSVAKQGYQIGFDDFFSDSLLVVMKWIKRNKLQNKGSRELNLANLLLQTAVQNTPEGHGYAPISTYPWDLTHLTFSVHILSDTNSAVECLQKAVLLTRIWLNRCALTKDISDSPIEHRQKAVQAAPKSHASFSMWEFYLGLTYWRRFLRSREMADCRAADSCRRAATQITGSPLHIKWTGSNSVTAGILSTPNEYQFSQALALIRGLDEPLIIPLEFGHVKAESQNRLQSLLASDNLRLRDSRAGRLVCLEAKSQVLCDILRELWTGVVWPVLQGIGYSSPPQNRNRIRWCASGPLTFLPLHAAGIYGSGSGYSRPCVPDFVVSSYTPTFTNLLEKLENESRLKRQKTEVLLLSQPNVLPHSPIPGTVKETDCPQETSRKQH